LILAGVNQWQRTMATCETFQALHVEENDRLRCAYFEELCFCLFMWFIDFLGVGSGGCY
jgi:hypothetical protein